LNPDAALSQIYFEALRVLEGRRFDALTNSFSSEQTRWLATFSNDPEKHKGVLTALITSLLKKVVAPAQDVRLHQEAMTGGYSRRSFDSKFVTPFLREQGFPNMRESGWSNRSLELAFAYNKNYPGKISPPTIKISFLSLLDDVQKNPSLARDFLVYLIAKLEQVRRSQGGSSFVRLPSAFAASLHVATICEMLETHFNATYKNLSGAARLPVIALYSLYQCLVPELARYKGKSLQPMRSPTANDVKVDTVGTIRVVTVGNGQLFEGLEIKYNAPLTLEAVESALQKFKMSPVKRYYLISNLKIKPEEQTQIERYALTVQSEYACELIVDEVLPVLGYGLRAISDPIKFLDNYAINLRQDRFIRSEHRLAWISILQGYSLQGD
jgi:DNA (cytosine-5)-methyltransferase 1